MTWLLLANFVDRMLVFHSMVVPDTKFEPLTVKVKAGPPCVPVFGEIDAIAGTGFVAGGGGVGLSPPQPKRLSAAIKVSAKKVGTPA